VPVRLVLRIEPGGQPLHLSRQIELVHDMRLSTQQA
jgi:hypothetical protein